MKALVFRHSLAREAASAIGGRVDRRAFVSRFAPARVENIDELTVKNARRTGAVKVLLEPAKDGGQAKMRSFWRSMALSQPATSAGSRGPMPT